MKKSVFPVNLILLILEIMAAIYLLFTEGLSMFRYYTIGSNVLQLLVSGWIVFWWFRHREDPLPVSLYAAHLISVVCLTVTFLIAALVLAPQEGFSYYFLENVAPINHFLGPVLSVLSLLLLETYPPVPKKAVLYPVLATLVYGILALILNYTRLLDGPYFFLRVYDTPVPTILMWFGIIAVLCLGLSWGYAALYRVRIRKAQKRVS